MSISVRRRRACARSPRSARRRRCGPRRRRWRRAVASAQAASANGHRAAKPHPVGGLERSGGEPGMEISSRSRSRMLGNAFFRPSVYGCQGWLNRGSVGASLHHPPGIHHADAVGGFGDHADVVRDQQDGQAHPLADLADAPEQALLHQHVQPGGRLVHHQQRGLEGQAHGDHRALAHAARELVREAVHQLGLQADDVEQFGHAFARLGGATSSSGPGWPRRSAPPRAAPG